MPRFCESVPRRTERPADEVETINKLIMGLDRTAADLTMIVEFGHPLDLKKQPGIDLTKIVQTMVTSLNGSPRMTGALTGPIVVDAQADAMAGEFDSAKLSEALTVISRSAMKMLGSRSSDQSLNIVVRRITTGDVPQGILEWKGFESIDYDPFRSFIGSDGIRLSLAAKVVEAHGGSAEKDNAVLRVLLPLLP